MFSKQYETMKCISELVLIFGLMFLVCKEIETCCILMFIEFNFTAYLTMLSVTHII
jgi:hypothetical protein